MPTLGYKLPITHAAFIVNLFFYINGGYIEYVEEWLHLGHAISK